MVFILYFKEPVSIEYICRVPALRRWLGKTCSGARKPIRNKY